MKLKNELKKAETTIKQLRDSETGHSAKAAGQAREIDRLNKENKELKEQVKELREKALEEVKKEVVPK